MLALHRWSQGLHWFRATVPSAVRCRPARKSESTSARWHPSEPKEGFDMKRVTIRAFTNQACSRRTRLSSLLLALFVSMTLLACSDDKNGGAMMDDGGKTDVASRPDLGAPDILVADAAVADAPAADAPADAIAVVDLAAKDTSIVDA